MTNRFASYIDSLRKQNTELPLVHTTRCETFSAIQAKGELAPQPCPVFKESLVYFFYGRPAYRSHRGNDPATNVVLCPVCFVFKPDSVAKYARVFPFDSGASRGGYFEPVIDRKDTGSFELTASIKSVRRVACRFFLTNSQYFLGDSARALKLPPTQTEAGQYHTLISSQGTASYDDRRSAIEIQARDAITLRDNLLAVILPTSFLEVANNRDTLLREWRTYPLTYNTVRGTRPTEYYAVVRDRLQRLLEQGGYL